MRSVGHLGAAVGEVAGGFWVVGGRSGSAGAGSVCLSWAPGAAVVRLGLGGGGGGAVSEVCWAHGHGMAPGGIDAAPGARPGGAPGRTRPWA